MASSSSNPRKRYHVFLSFRGPDVRNYFLGHLYMALDGEGINTYRDDQELRKGERISTELTKAIEESHIAIVVFSKNYASSMWCLEELVEIMKRKEQRDLTVFPVFYKVDPCEVRTPRESYLEAMTKHEDKFGKDSERVTRWKNALSEAGSLSGWHFTDGYEAGLIQHIVQEISTQLDRVPLDVAKYPVGIDARVQKLRTILNLQSKDDVLMVGLWGQGGVGKTTLAKAIYNAVFREFEGSSFSERVRENCKSPGGLVALQEKLLSEVLLGKKFTVCSVARGSCLIQDRLHNKKVLIILDDVNDAWQLDALAGNCNWFGNGSRIIITTRDKHILISHGVNRDHMYEVEALKNSAALELFRKHAFQGNQEIEISSNLVDRVLLYASGLPLALEVLGSSLCGRGENEWTSTLQKLAKSPDKKINDMLKVSYDGLEDYAKEIFLDITCFFKGRDTEYIKKVLDSCDFDTTIGVNNLIERSLIREEQGTLQMHDLTQSMGMDIVKEECRDDPGKRSRLWLYDDVLDVLLGDVGTDLIKAIVLELPKPEVQYIGPNAFTNMRKLRLLILHNVDNSFSGPIHLPNELRWFEWPQCAPIPEFRDGPKKLVGLDLWNTNIGGVLKQFKENLYISDCQQLQEIPKIPGKLRQLKATSCKSLSRIPSNIFDVEIVELDSCQELVRNGFSVNDWFKLEKFHPKTHGQVILPGEEMPKWLLPNKEGYISFVASKKLYMKFLGVAFCIVFRAKGKRFCSFKLDASVGGRQGKVYRGNLHSYNLDHVCLGYRETKDMWRLDDFGPNDSSHFHVSIRVYDNVGSRVIVKKCGFRLICKPLENDLEVLLEDDQLLDPALLYEVGYEDSQMSTEEDSSSETENLQDSQTSTEEDSLRGKGLNVADFSIEKHRYSHIHPHYRNVRPGGEMPKEFVLVEESTISFMASQDLYDKFVGLVLFVVFGVEDGKKEISFDIVPHVNGERRNGLAGTLGSFDSDHMWIQYLIPNVLWGVLEGAVDFDQFEESYLRFSLAVRVSGGTVKKLGYLLSCMRLEDDLKVVLEDNQLMDPASLCEDFNSEDDDVRFRLPKYLRRFHIFPSKTD